MTADRPREWLDHAELTELIAEFTVRDPATGCWEWTGQRRGGRPALRIATSWRTAAAWAWRAHRAEPLTHAMKLKRQCPNPGCVAPDHHLLVDRRQ